MRLNGNQIDALSNLREDEDLFHFDIKGTDPLDKRVVIVSAFDFEYSKNKVVKINENGTVCE